MHTNAHGAAECRRRGLCVTLRYARYHKTGALDPVQSASHASRCNEMVPYIPSNSSILCQGSEREAAEMW